MRTPKRILSAYEVLFEILMLVVFVMRSRCRDFLELDVSLPQDKVKEVSEVAVAHINAAVVELRRLFLVEDLVDSIKFGVLLWTLTYLGSWFNGMTLIIIGIFERNAGESGRLTGVLQLGWPFSLFRKCTRQTRPRSTPIWRS